MTKNVTKNIDCASTQYIHMELVILIEILLSQNVVMIITNR